MVFEKRIDMYRNMTSSGPRNSALAVSKRLDPHPCFHVLSSFSVSLLRVTHALTQQMLLLSFDRTILPDAEPAAKREMQDLHSRYGRYPRAPLPKNTHLEKSVS